MTYRVYLAGPLQDANLKDEIIWRERMTEELGKHEIEGVFPPEMSAYISSGTSPCQADIERLKTCQALFSNLHMLSAGTLIEMYVAKYEVQIPVLTLCEIGNPSPWISYVTSAFVVGEKEAIWVLARMRDEMSLLSG